MIMGGGVGSGMELIRAGDQTSGITTKECHAGGEESQRDSASKPKVARHELPWGARESANNPNGVVANATPGGEARNCPNRVAVEDQCGTITQGSFAPDGPRKYDVGTPDF